ncbi:hypothetical protein J6590_034721 [Homalodisca vitripennis]|nr:hypothetical protein J6590_034721 [Homalodisca vitripennis]
MHHIKIINKHIIYSYTPIQFHCHICVLNNNNPYFTFELDLLIFAKTSDLKFLTTGDEYKQNKCGCPGQSCYLRQTDPYKGSLINSAVTRDAVTFSSSWAPDHSDCVDVLTITQVSSRLRIERRPLLT